MKKEDHSLYFIALLPQEPTYSKVIGLKEEIRARYESKAALRSPPHITLHMPFKWKPHKESILFTTLEQIASNHSSFSLEFKNFGCFEPRVIYVGVKESADLTNLQSQVAKRVASDWHIYPQPGSRPFQPHMTIGFRDLKKPRFYKAWEEFASREFNGSSVFNHLCLLKHNGKSWDVYKEIPFSSNL